MNQSEVEQVRTLTLPDGVRLELISDGAGYKLLLGSAERDGADHATSASRWLVEQLDEAADTTPSASLPGDFRLRRLIRPGLPPVGERLIPADQTNTSVIVGEQVVVKWLRRVDDAEHPALLALTHLAEVGFTGVPATFGALTWQSGKAEVPLGIATAYLPGAADGWEWCVAALETGERPEFPTQLGRLLAGLHSALATPSSVFSVPFASADNKAIRRWHTDARSRLAEVADRVIEVDGADAGTDGQRPQRSPSAAINTHRKAMAAVIDRLLDLPGPTPIQHTHGDLHVGQILSWTGGLAVIDFDGNPVLGPTPDAASGHHARMQSPVRDLAQLMLSMDQVGRIVNRRSGFTITAEIDDWSRSARADVLAAYQRELAVLGGSDVLDIRLLPTFLVEQACRDLLYAIRFLPRWAYATIDGLDTILDDLDLD